MRVIKRSGRVEDVKFNKVTNRISKLKDGLSENVDISIVAQQVFSSMYDEMKTHEMKFVDVQKAYDQYEQYEVEFV